MTTDFDEYFGNAPNTTSNNNLSHQDDNFEPAQFWLNVGYQDKVDIDEGTETRFINLDEGISLDKLEELTIDISNELSKIIHAARHELVSQIMNAAQSLDPGEARIVGDADGRHGLQLLLCRATLEHRAIKADAKPITRNLTLVC